MTEVCVTEDKAAVVVVASYRKFFKKSSSFQGPGERTSLIITRNHSKGWFLTEIREGGGGGGGE